MRRCSRSLQTAASACEATTASSIAWTSLSGVPKSNFFRASKAWSNMGKVLVKFLLEPGVCCERVWNVQCPSPNDQRNPKPQYSIELWKLGFGHSLDIGILALGI